MIEEEMSRQNQKKSEDSWQVQWKQQMAGQESDYWKGRI